MTIGQKIKELRRSKGLSQKNLADKVGITQVHLSHIETNKIEVRATTINKICECLDYSPLMLVIALIDTSTLSVEKKLLFEAGVELIEKSLK